MSKRMDKIKNILSPGRSADDKILYNTGERETTPSRAANNQAALGAAQQAAAGSFADQSHLQSSPVRDNISTVSIKSGVAGGSAPAQMPVATTSTQHQNIAYNTTSAMSDRSTANAALAAASTAAAPGAAHDQQQVANPFGTAHHEGYAHVQPVATANKIALGGGSRSEDLEKPPQFANRPPPQYDPHGRQELAEAAAAVSATGTHFHNRPDPEYPSSGTRATNSDPSAVAAAHTAMTENSGHQQIPQGSSGRGTSAAGAGVAAAVGSGYVTSLSTAHARQDTGPAPHTIGPHSSDVANVLDPRVQPRSEQMKQDPLIVEAADTGPAPNTIGPHKSDVLNILDPRVQPDPAKMKTSDDIDPVGKASLMQAPGQDPDAVRSSNVPVSTPASAVGLAAGTAINSAAETGSVSAPYSDRGALSDMRSESYQGGSSNPYSSAPLDPRLAGGDMPGGFPETPGQELPIEQQKVSTGWPLQDPGREAHNVITGEQEPRDAIVPEHGTPSQGLSGSSTGYSASQAIGDQNVGIAEAKSQTSAAVAGAPYNSHSDEVQATSTTNRHHGLLSAAGAGILGGAAVGAIASTEQHAPTTNEDDDYDPFKYDHKAQPPSGQSKTIARRVEPPKTVSQGTVRGGGAVVGVAGVPAAAASSQAVSSTQASAPSHSAPLRGDDTQQRQQPGNSVARSDHNMRDAGVAGGAGVAGIGAYEALKTDGATKQSSSTIPASYQGPGTGQVATGIYPQELNQPHYHRPTTAETAGGLAPDSATGNEVTQRSANMPASTRAIYGTDASQPHPHSPTSARTAGGLQGDSVDGRGGSTLGAGIAGAGVATATLNSANRGDGGVAIHDHARDNPPTAAQRDPVGAIQSATSRRLDDQRAVPFHHGHEVDPVTGEPVHGEASTAAVPTSAQVTQVHPHGLVGATGGAAAGFALSENNRPGAGASGAGPGRPESSAASNSRLSEEGPSSPKQKKHRFSGILHRKSRSRDLNEENKTDSRLSSENTGYGVNQADSFDNGGRASGDFIDGRSSPSKGGIAGSKISSQSGRNKLHKDPPARWQEAQKIQATE